MGQLRISRRQVLAATVIGGFSSLLMSCEGKARRILRLGCNAWPGYAPFFLAADLGYLPRDRFRIIGLPSTTEVLRALENGLLDTVAVTLDEALLLQARGIALKIVLVTDISHGGDAIVARPWFEGFASLKGRRIGVEGTALGAYVLSRALDLSGLKIGDLEVEQLTPAEQETAFEAGLVDAVVAFDPVRSRLLERGAREVFTSREIPGEIVDVLAVPATVLADRQASLKSLIDGWFRALDFLWREPDTAARMLASHLAMTPHETLSALGRMHLPDRSETTLLLGSDPRSLAPVLDRLQGIMLDKGLLDRPPATDNLLDPRFVRENRA